MTSFSSLRVRLVGTVLLAIAPAWVLMYFFAFDPPWMRFALGLLALGAAWYGGERFILRQVRLISRAARSLAAGDYSTRIGPSKGTDELSGLACTFDTMAESVEKQAKEREQAERTLLSRSLQQTVVSALGQLALVTNYFGALLNQAVVMVAQTLEVEYTGVLELQADGKFMLLCAGVGWKEGTVGHLTQPADPRTQLGFTLTAGEPVVVRDLARETRFRGSGLLLQHGVISGVTVAIVGQGRAFGVLGAHTTHRRDFTEDEVHFLLAVATVLAMAAARRQAEAALEKLAAFAQLNPNPAMELAADGSITYANAAAHKLAESIGQTNPQQILPTNVTSILSLCLNTQESKVRLETRQAGRTLSWSFHPVVASQVVHAYVDDISERLNLEEQFRQAQKMESVALLAAGVAHDFNNMLTIIQGHSGLLLAKSTEQPEFLRSAQAIFFAAERASTLTKQLLMFSRKNVMQPKPLDLREVVAHLSKMLQRLLGEPIQLDFTSPPQLPLVHADAGMIDQILMNLAVNARDAMPKGGRLIISTEAVEITDSYVETHAEARPGQFVTLRVADTGCGMDPQTLARIFEPFFTTKEVGKGTGLGLATVYGIVKQHAGWIEVASEVGQGTVFTVYLPASAAAAETPPDETSAPAGEMRGGNETILVVEDELVLREMACTILQDCGYRIMEAGTGREALQIWDRRRQDIDLVLTDMVMPEGMSGMELAHQLHATKPTVKIILASGYSMDDLDTNFLRDGYAAFLQKPYTYTALAKAVRACLDQSVRAPQNPASA